MPPEYIGGTLGDWLTPWNGQSYDLKHHLQLTTKQDVGNEESVTGGYQEKRKSIQNKVKVLMKI